MSASPHVRRLKTPDRILAARARGLATSSVTSTQPHSRKQTVKLTYSLSYLRLVNRHREAVKAGKLSKPQTTVRLMNWAASQRNFSASLGLKQTTRLLIGRGAWSRREECALPTSTVASQRLDRQQQDRLRVIESLQIRDSPAFCRARLSHRALSFTYFHSN